jgi:hypothetical protein
VFLCVFAWCVRTTSKVHTRKTSKQDATKCEWLAVKGTVQVFTSLCSRSSWTFAGHKACGSPDSTSGTTSPFKLCPTRSALLSSAASAECSGSLGGSRVAIMASVLLALESSVACFSLPSSTPTRPVLRTVERVVLPGVLGTGGVSQICPTPPPLRRSLRYGDTERANERSVKT